ncbi:hypothetical protein BH23DEI1_BH23DEI1_06270 [soil metagenome]
MSASRPDLTHPETVRAEGGGKRSGPRKLEGVPAPTRPRRRRRDWTATLARPHVIVAFLALVASLPYLLGAFGARSADVALPTFGEREGERVVEREMPLVIVGSDGVVRTAVATVESAGYDTSRLRATLAALRDTLVGDDVWPSDVGPPDVSLFESNRRRVVVIDVPAAGRLPISVAQEWATLRSLIETMRAAGADDVRVIVAGAPAATLWGNVALP